MSLTQDLQSLEPGSVVQLVEVDGTAFGMDRVLRFHAHHINADGWASFAGENLPSIRWQGNEYDPHPYTVTGLELTSTGSQPQPGLSVGNIGNHVTALCLAYDDLVQAKVKIHTTLAKYLDAANWQAGNPLADSTQERVQLFYVNAKVSETPEQVDFELCTPFDIQNLQLPTRQISPVCIWAMRGWYRSGNDCDYQGTKYFTKEGIPTDDPSKDVCGGRLSSDCKPRFGHDQPLPFGGQPGGNLQGR